jgi:hypothetical protein
LETSRRSLQGTAFTCKIGSDGEPHSNAPRWLGIKVIADCRYEQDVRDRIVEEKTNAYKKVIDHDAIVVPRSPANGCYREGSESRDDNDEGDGGMATLHG